MFEEYPGFKPMLAYTYEEGDKLNFPVLASPKLDGIRMIISGKGEPRTRSLKKIPNEFLRKRFTNPAFAGFDGEIIVGAATAHDVYRTTNSAVMSEDGEPDGLFYIFDYVAPDMPYQKRLELLHQKILKLPIRLKGGVVFQQLIHNMEELLEFEQQQIDLGYEGVMIRDPNGGYKFGRATKRSGELGKVKRFRDDEAVIVGFEERMHNGNEATKDELGRTKRSSHSQNLTGLNTLGALVVDHPAYGQFSIGTGFTAAEAQRIWDKRETFLGKLAKFKYFPVGLKDKPRHPVFLGIREDI